MSFGKEYLRGLSILCIFLFGLILLESVGCSSGTCENSPDCPAGQICRNQKCIPIPDAANVPDQEGPGTPDNNNPKPDNVVEDNNPTDPGTNPTDENGGEVAPEGEPVPEIPPAPKPAPGEIVINEVMADPPTGAAGDANKDQKQSSTHDEFVELVNWSGKTLDIGGVTLNDEKGKVLITFKAGTRLDDKQAIVVFGGGMDTPEHKKYVNLALPHPMFGGALVYTKSLGLTNTSRTLTLLAEDKTEISKFGYGDGNCPGGSSIDQSITLSPDITGKCAKHKDVSPTKSLFSPGTRLNGDAFSKPQPEPVPEVAPEGPTEGTTDGVTEQPPADGGTVEVTPEVTPEVTVDTMPDKVTPEGPTDSGPTASKPGVGDLVINELMADPPAGAAGDANKDQKPSTTQDEFIEIVNTSTKTLDLEGVMLKDAKASKTIFTFPKGAILKPKQAAVVFGGGMATAAHTPYVNKNVAHPTFGNALVYTKSLSLTNTGKTIELHNAGGTKLSTFAYGVTGCPGGSSIDSSLTLSPDLTGKCAKHKDVASNKAAYSPGTKLDGSSF